VPPLALQTITVDTTQLSQLSGEEIPYVYLRKRPYKSDNRNYFPTGCDDQDPVDGCRRAAPGDVYTVECIVRGEQDWPTGQGLWKYAKVRVANADPVTGQTYAYLPQAAYKPDLPVSGSCPAS
jgi:hypothetical protein